MNLRQRCLDLLHNWALFAEADWYSIPGQPALGCYGSGYNSWGVQTNQKYVAAMAVLATLGRDQPGLDLQWALDRALAALRFSLASHHTGNSTCTDGSKWGRTWISALGVERMVHAIELLGPQLTDEDREGVQHMFVDQANWLLDVYAKTPGIVGDPWASSGRNKPESNLWNGAACWRAAAMYPDHPRAADWQEVAHQFLINAVSVPADANDDRVLAGKPIRERFTGANFHPDYALDHHGYLNVGYMMICNSNAAMLHFDLRLQNLPAPQTLHHHQADLWNVVRRLIFADGRLARVGGDTRVRYAYCQEYLLPSLLYAADQLGDQHALGLVDQQIKLIEDEARVHNDGSFYAGRLDYLRTTNPYYYTRLESDRACALGMVVAYEPLVRRPALPAEDFEQSTAGTWCDRSHSVVVHRSRRRLASFAWRAQGLTQGMCQPPDDGHLAEWEQNLAGCIQFAGDPGIIEAGKHRELQESHIDLFDGGFLTRGSVREGCKLTLLEGWTGSDSALHQIVFAALPDGQSVVGLQFCQTGPFRRYLLQAIGLKLNIPNDLYNNFRRTLHTARSEVALTSPPPSDACLCLDSTWANLDNRVGVVGIYGAQSLCVSRSSRRGGKFHSVFVEELCWHCVKGPVSVDGGSTILDVGWLVISDADTPQTQQAARGVQAISGLPADVRGVRVTGADGNTYALLANFGSTLHEIDLAHATSTPANAVTLLAGPTASNGVFQFSAGAAALVRCSTPR